MPTSESSRRAFIKTIGAVAAATCGRSAAAKAQDYKPQDQKKLTQAAAALVSFLTLPGSVPVIQKNGMNPA